MQQFVIVLCRRLNTDPGLRAFTRVTSLFVGGRRYAMRLVNRNFSSGCNVVPGMWLCDVTLPPSGPGSKVYCEALSRAVVWPPAGHLPTATASYLDSRLKNHCQHSCSTNEWLLTQLLVWETLNYQQ